MLIGIGFIAVTVLPAKNSPLKKARWQTTTWMPEYAGVKNDTRFAPHGFIHSVSLNKLKLLASSEDSLVVTVAERVSDSGGLTYYLQERNSNQWYTVTGPESSVFNSPVPLNMLITDGSMYSVAVSPLESKPERVAVMYQLEEYGSWTVTKVFFLVIAGLVLSGSAGTAFYWDIRKYLKGSEEAKLA